MSGMRGMRGIAARLAMLTRMRRQLGRIVLFAAYARVGELCWPRVRVLGSTLGHRQPPGMRACVRACAFEVLCGCVGVCACECVCVRACVCGCVCVRACAQCTRGRSHWAYIGLLVMTSGTSVPCCAVRMISQSCTSCRFTCECAAQPVAGRNHRPRAMHPRNGVRPACGGMHARLDTRLRHGAQGATRACCRTAPGGRLAGAETAGGSGAWHHTSTSNEGRYDS